MNGVCRRGPPQAISPINEIKRVHDYAVTVIPTNKIFTGFQIYARDWLIPHEGDRKQELSICRKPSDASNIMQKIKYDGNIPIALPEFSKMIRDAHMKFWFEVVLLPIIKAKFDLVVQGRGSQLLVPVIRSPRIGNCFLRIHSLYGKL